MVKNKIKHILPLLLALVVLIGCIPPIQASAASSLTLSGVWRIGSGWFADVDHGDIRDFNISVDAYIFVNGQKKVVTQVFLDARDPQSLGAGSSSNVDRYWDDSGDHWADDGLIYFNSPVTITDPHAIAFFSTYAWECEPNILFIDAHEEHRHYSIWTSQCVIDASGATFDCNLCSWSFVWTPSASKGTFLGFNDSDGGFYSGQVVIEFDGSLYLSSTYSSPVVPDPEPDPDPTPDPDPDPDPDPEPDQVYYNIIKIDSLSYPFSAVGSPPTVYMTVTSTGCTLTDGSITYYVTYSGAGSFGGYAASKGGTVVFAVGSEVELSGLPGEDTTYNLYSCLGAVYATVIHIGSAEYVFMSDFGAVNVMMYVTEYGVVMDSGTQLYEWTPNGLFEFYGLSSAPNATVPDYVDDGSYWYVYGSADEVVEASFYPVYGENKVNPLPGYDFASWLTTAIGGFLSFEIVPGFSLSEILGFFIFLGLLFWVLRLM